MVNDILYGISTALNTIFPDCPIYTDNVEQGLIEPCFFIIPLESSETRLLGNRAYRTIQFNLSYVSKAKRLQLESIADKLYPILRQVKLLDESLINGFDLHHEIVDGVLHFFVTFKPTIIYEIDKMSNMENLATNMGVKDEK